MNQYAAITTETSYFGEWIHASSKDTNYPSYLCERPSGNN